jgi:hypothetical protein
MEVNMTIGKEEPVVGREDSEMEQEVAEDVSVERVDLEITTTEPEAVVERSSDFVEAEAIEEAVVKAVEANAPPTEEIVEASHISGDADDRPTEEIGGVESSNEIEIPALDGSSRELSGDADDRPTEEVVPVVEGWSTSGDADDRPTEEVAAADAGWSTSGDADDRPTEEITAATQDVFTRAFLEEEFFQRLLVDPESALEEHGLRQEDLPDLSDPSAPEAVTIIQGVEDAVLEGIQDREQPPVRDDRPPDDSDDMRSILLQGLMDRRGTVITTLSKLIGQSHDTAKSIIQNMK